MDAFQYEQRIKELELAISNLTSHSAVASLQKEMSFRQAIEDAIPSGIAVVDEKGKQVYVNPSFCKMLGWEQEELIGMTPPYIYWAQQDIENINKALNQTLNKNIPKEGFDLVFKHKNGKLINVNVNIAPFIQEKNKMYFLANVLDITDRKKAEDALKKSELLLSYSLDSQNDTIIFSIDRKYQYLYFNRAHADAMKYAYNSDIKFGINFLDCISSDGDRKLLKENIDRAFKGESHSLIQSFGKTNVDYYEVFFNPIINENKEIIGCSSLARNISDRKAAEEALRDSETKFREIINQIDDAIIVFDGQAKIAVWNKGAEHLSGLKAEEVLDKSIVDVQYQLVPLPNKNKPLIEEAITNIVTYKTPERFNQIIDSEIVPYNSDKTKNIQSIVFPIKLEGYNLFCTVIRDVTEIKRYEKELLRISNDKDRFYSVIAQYLYTPFNSFYNFTKLMAVEMDTLPLREIQKMVIMMSKSATNLYSLLDNMLQWTRMNQGKISFEPQNLNFKRISEEAVSILKPIADSKNIKINHIAEEELIVFADIFMLKTILRNLVSNAIKYTNTEGQIEITAQKSPSDIIVSVLDNGIGINPEYSNRLFNMPDMPKVLDKAEEKGTTLGLLLCKEFVEKHGGKIWVESRNGKGSEFKFTMPVYDSQTNKLIN
jgi:PAS domain S-box-containing protein